MRWLLPLVLACPLPALLAGPGLAQNQNKYAAPPAKAPDAETLKAIADKTKRLGQLLTDLRKQGVPDRVLVDVEVYHRAAESIVQLQEFFQKDSAAWTLDTLD